eukprot:2670209-Rhodomonas_salina.1
MSLSTLPDVHANAKHHLCLLLHRVEGLRIQHLLLKKKGTAEAVNMALVDVSMDAGDCLSVKVTSELNSRKRLHVKYKLCKFVFTFGQEENSAWLQSSRGGYRVDVQLRDPVHSLKEITFSHFDMEQCPRMRRSVVINNLCGKAFLSSRICGKKFKDVGEANGVDFGCVLEIATVSGIISIKRDMQTVLVKGVSNAEEMMQDLKYLTGNQDANPLLEIHMVVLSGCLGVVIDVSLGCLLEKTLQFWYKGLFVVICRHEEASNHMEIQSILSEETSAVFLRVFNGKCEVGRILTLSPCDVSLNISISRFGEVLFRVSFSSVVVFSSEMEEWVRDVCSLKCDTSCLGCGWESERVNDCIHGLFCAIHVGRSSSDVNLMECIRRVLSPTKGENAMTL